MSAPDSTPPPPQADAERARVLEFQLDYLRAELLHLTHERYRMEYSVSGALYRFLRPIEAWIAARLPRRSAPAPEPTAVGFSDDLRPPALPTRRILVDVTGTVKRDAGTGIQRVVKEVVRVVYLRQRDGAGFDVPVVAVRCENGRLLLAADFINALAPGAAGSEEEIAVAPGDRFLMLSDSWNAFDVLAPALAGVRRNGGEIVSCIFDLIPELWPHACHEATVPRYRAWLRRALLESDAFIAISRTVALELGDYVETCRLPHRPGLKIGWFHCGADLHAPATHAPRPKIAAAVTGDAPVFLLVGTIEPRKGHRVALAAFERLWSEGVAARLVIVGRRGWFEEAIVAAIGGHAENGARLFWFDDVDDPELSFLYDRATALVFPSYAEGFGLPIVEAARRGLPTICSDIPVFREVGRSGAIYFAVNDPDALAETLRGFLSGSITAAPEDVSDASWAAAAARIVDVIAREDWLRRLP